MKYDVFFHPAAQVEMAEAAEFYEAASSGLGADFLQEVEHAIGQICTNPELAPLLKGAVRRKVMRKFPYSVLYIIGSEQIRILAIMHHRRRPFYWRTRK